MPQTVEDFRTEIIHNLSGTLVDVELAPEDIDMAFKMAKRTWSQFGNNNTNRDFFQLPVEAGVSTYTVDESIEHVSNVIRPTSFHADNGDPFTPSAYNQMFNHDSMTHKNNFMIYDLTKQMMDTIKQYIVHDPEYIFNKRDHTIKFLKAPHSNQGWMLDVYHYATDAELYDNLWIIRYTTAECKRILGRAYRKFGSLPSPTGENQIDGNELVQEGNDEKQKLEEEIMEFIYGDPDGLGVWIG